MDEQKIKLVIWDLDQTIWNGILTEDEHVELRPGIREVIKTLDSRGILQSVSSKNNYEDAMGKLREFGLEEYFLYPQIGWNAKSVSVSNIVRLINIGQNTVAFVDDQDFELEEVKFTLPDIICINAAQIDDILEMEVIKPNFITVDAKNRRKMYQSDMKRKEAEESFEGPKESFLGTLGIELFINTAEKEDLQRAEELTIRTHQLNTTGYTYSYEELEQLQSSEAYLLLTAGLKDRFGDYGKIGLALVELSGDIWKIKLFLMSCRTMSTGAGSVFLDYVIRLAHEHGKQLLAEFVLSDRNKMMYVTYKFAGFEVIGREDEAEILKNNFQTIRPVPNYMKLHVDIKHNF